MDEQTNRRKLHEILDIVLDANGLGCRSKDKTGPLPTLFYRFSGHVAQLTVDLHPDGWSSGAGKDEFIFDTDENIPVKKVEQLRTAVSRALDPKSKMVYLRSELAQEEARLRTTQERINELKKQIGEDDGREVG